jgi:outer membrane protein OmpA-like peptidoglycan-associated protein
MKTQHLLFFLVGAITLTNAVYADEVNFGKQKPSASQIIDALNPTEANDDVSVHDAGGEDNITGKRKFRSIGPLTPVPTYKAEIKQAPKKIKSSKPKTEKALSLEILFLSNSAELTDAAKDQLEPVGEALASETLQHLNFIVEGHTDAKGGYSYNKTLSEERADAVKYFLKNNFAIEASRIQVIGKGKTRLLDPKHPYSGVNRRVRIVATK